MRSTRSTASGNLWSASRVAGSENPPLHLLLGANTIPRLQGKIDALLKDVSNWTETTTGADFPAGK